MDKPFKYPLPSPNFNKNAEDACKPKRHYLTPSGMSLLPREKQPPPMYGKHGATLPARYLQQQVVKGKQFPTPATIIPSEKQYCEPCDLELHSLEDLKRHRSQHERCPVEGCLYSGHPSVMDKHINALHTSGLFEKFKKFSTPEEIAAWREERRKRYPTVANVMLKQKAKEQRQMRGERLDSHKQRFGKVNDRKRAQPIIQENKGNDDKRRKEENKRNKNRKNRKSKRNKKSKNPDLKPETQIEENEKNKNLEEDAQFSWNGIPTFTGTSQLENYKHLSKKKVATNNALFGLVGIYGSDDDDEKSEETNEDSDSNLEKIEVPKANDIVDDKCNINPTGKNIEELEKNETSAPDSIVNIENLSQNSSTLSTTPIEKIAGSVIDEKIENCSSKENDNLSDEAPEEKPIQRSIPDCAMKAKNNPTIIFSDKPETRTSELSQQKSNYKQKQLLTRKSGLDYRKAHLRKQNTMLEKLLESDIRHERNVLLQCVRYVCENNFFNIGQKQKCLEENK